MAYPTTVFAGFGAEKQSSSTKKRALGTKLELPDGRIFRYALNGGVALTAGKTVAAPVPVANHDMDLVTAAAAVGAKSITVTLGATAATANQYTDGYLYVNDGPGEGQIFAVGDHLAIGTGGSGAINLVDTDKVNVALTSASLTGLQTSPYSSVVVSPHTNANRTVGVPNCAIAASEYGWIQTRGPAAVWILGTQVVGQHIRISANASDSPGAVANLDRSGSGEDEQVVGEGFAPIAVTTDYAYVYLTIE